MQTDQLPSFNGDFSGFPKRLPADTVHYHIWVVNKQLTDNQVRTRLHEVSKASSQLLKNLTKDYIWQKDPFDLRLERYENTWRLTGSSNYGESIADEWLITYFIRDLSKQFDDVWCRIYDNDGDFLLIEAADQLPGWLDPDIAENRVWLHKGQIQLISLEAFNDGAPHKSLTVAEALQFIADNPTRLSHFPVIDKEAFHRLRHYPATIQENIHHSLVTLPRKVAYLLRRNAGYVSAAVEAFYLRDPVSMRLLKTEDAAELQFPPHDLVTASFRFNRTCFAQVKGQQFPAPLVWKRALSHTGSNDTDATSAETGMKLTCGFEMLMRDEKEKDNRVVREINLLLEDLDNGDDHLPTAEELALTGNRNDSEEWMNISIDDFDKVLSGQAKGPIDDPSSTAAGFMDRALHEDMRRMTERFRKIMEDETIEEGDEDEDDEDGNDDDDESDDDRDIDFDHERFTKLMREAMGLPAEATTSSASYHEYPETTKPPTDQTNNEDDDEEEEEDDEIRLLTARMEAELNAQGAFRLDPEVKKKLEEADEARRRKDSMYLDGGGGTIEEDDSDDEDGEGEVEIDFEAAKKLLRDLEMATGGSSGMMKDKSKMMGEEN